MGKNTTKDTILKSALKVFVEKSFAGSSINRIAKTAGINQSLIYHHFDSKEDLWICTSLNQTDDPSSYTMKSYSMAILTVMKMLAIFLK